jgi:hypothetical protein
VVVAKLDDLDSVLLEHMSETSAFQGKRPLCVHTQDVWRDRF